LSVVVISYNPFVEDIILENLERIRSLNYRFHGARL